MEVSAVNSVQSAIQTVGGKTLGKQDFLNLLIKQLGYQDPLNPMDSTQFTSQLTQFSSLEQLSNINTTLNDVLSFQHSMQNASVANLIGRTVKVPGDGTYLGSTADIGYELSGDAATVEISVYDGSGNLVVAKKLGAQSKGENKFVWDGKDTQGNQMPEGNYTFEIQAKDVSGNDVSTAANSTGKVTGVVFEDGVTYLVLDSGRNINLSEIEAIQ
ncbi:MAG: flagellar biosynthesis protein FlgD [Nitrospirae bacterium]|nr:flagellar biosynthesis protein FlgD [Nitrospirota bacterium]